MVIVVEGMLWMQKGCTVKGEDANDVDAPNREVNGEGGVVGNRSVLTAARSVRLSYRRRIDRLGSRFIKIRPYKFIVFFFIGDVLNEIIILYYEILFMNCNASIHVDVDF